MIIELEKLVEVLDPNSNSRDTPPGNSLWIKCAPYPKSGKSKYEKIVSVEYRTPDGNTVVNVNVDQQGAILGIEIFP